MKRTKKSLTFTKSKTKIKSPNLPFSSRTFYKLTKPNTIDFLVVVELASHVAFEAFSHVAFEPFVA